MILSATSSSTFVAFLVASIILAITPGPGVFYILTRTLNQGRRAGLASILGIAFGNLGNAVAASIGLAAVLSASSAAFLIVKFAGAAYLIWLGIKALRGTSADLEIERPQTSSTRLAVDGFWVALLNPKTALFFAALLPQFINPAAPALAQSIGLGCLFVAIAMCTDMIYVLGASILAPTIRRRSGFGSYGRYISAATFMGLGIFAAIMNPRLSK
ncbi:LysE family translocator [Rhizobium leguminosarum]